MKLLITGAAGRIGQLLIRRLEGQFDLVLSDQKTPTYDGGFPFMTMDISDMASVEAVFSEHVDIHTVIHLAADPSTHAPWESLLPNNIIGTYTVFEAARTAGVKRIIHASSINAVLGYPADVQVKHTMPVRPPNLYGASKAWGEAVGRFYADEHDMSVHCLRIGWLTAHNADVYKNRAPDELAMTLTERDLMHFFDVCLASDIDFGIWHVLSNNRFKTMDISAERNLLGYAPQDDGFVLAGPDFA